MWVEKTKEGKFKFREQYMDPLTGKNKTVNITLEKNTATTRRLALEELTKKIKQKQGYCNIQEITLEQLIEKYENYQKHAVKQSTSTRNHYACAALKEILGKNILVNQLTAQYVKERFLNTGKSPGTLNELRARLSALIRWGYENDYIADVSFLNKVKPFKDVPHRKKIQDKYLESEEVEKLLDAMDDCWTWKYFTEFLILSGLRFGEAAALTYSDIDYDNKLIHVTKTYDSVNKVTTSTKTDCSCRDVYMQPELETLLHRAAIFTKEEQLRKGYRNPDKLFFLTTTLEHVNHPAYNKYLKSVSLKSIGREITPHTLRHTHASLLLEKGVSIDTISRRLGHKNSKVTREIYLHITKKLQEKDNQQIERIKII